MDDSDCAYPCTVLSPVSAQINGVIARRCNREVHQDHWILGVPLFFLCEKAFFVQMTCLGSSSGLRVIAAYSIHHYAAHRVRQGCLRQMKRRPITRTSFACALLCAVLLLPQALFPVETRGAGAWTRRCAGRCRCRSARRTSSL